MSKKEIRKTYKTLRAALSEEEVEQKSLEIANRLLSLGIWDYTYFHLFLPIIRQREVDTTFILHILSGRDKQIVVSRSDFATMDMSAILLTDSTVLRNNEYGIAEPEDGIDVPLNKIEVVFVPLLAFDVKGHRIGYGKGFYDRFLARLPEHVVKIGLSFFDAEPEFQEVFESDIRLNYCVTPERVYRFDTD